RQPLLNVKARLSLIVTALPGCSLISVGREKPAGCADRGHGGKSLGKQRYPSRSPLRELEALARLLVAVLLALDHAGIAGEEAVVAQGGLEVGPVLLERPGQAEHDRARLAVLAAAADVDEHVDPAAHLGADERGADVVP